MHALIVINGVCAGTSAQLPDVQYRLVRVLGRIVGLGWSQANVNVQTRNPPPNSDDFAGFPVMHFTDPINCVPISVCYPNAALPKLDDATALARLYPASGNSQATGRVWGSVYFTDAAGIAVQPMQGVNVVARLLVGGLPSSQYVVTSVSGFLFHGNAGNIINGYVDAKGHRFDRWGSNDGELEGFYDLGQLMIPVGQTIAEYQLSVEALDANWSLGVEPYAPGQVAPSGTFAPVVVTVVSGSNAERDILMLQDEVAQAHPGSGSTYTTPAPLPADGDWGSWISGYGSVDFFQFTAQANRTASVSVTALDENGRPTQGKLLPVIGIWQLSDQSGNPAPASTPSPFNSTKLATTRLDAQFSGSDTYRVGIADSRGDGRPDYFYEASLLYSDHLTPARLSLAGGITTLHGIGFKPGLQVAIGGNNSNVLSASASAVEVAAPGASQDGVAGVQVMDPVTGGFSQMTGALAYGALATDQLLLLQGGEPATAVGSQGANAIRVRAVAADGVTPVSGATIAWSATNGLQFSACKGASTCSVLSDEAGESSSWVTPTATGPSSITVALAPLSYSPPQTQSATVLGTSSALDLAALTPTRWIGQGATVAVPLTVEVLDLGVPQPNVAINFKLTTGTASLSSASATTNGFGFASVTASVANQNSDVQVTACVALGNSPCQTFTLFSTPSSMWTLETVSGSSQAVTSGQVFQPLAMRVTDGSLAANPVLGVPVRFKTTLATIGHGQGGPPGGGSSTSGASQPVLLGSSQAQVVTSQDGIALIVPSAENVGPCDVFVAVNAGNASVQFQMENLAAMVPIVPIGKPRPRISPREVSVGFAAPADFVPPVMLFAVPQGEVGADPAPAPESHASSTEQAEANAFATTDAVVGESVAESGGRAKSVSVKKKTRQKKIVILKAVSGSAKLVFDDKRTCRVLAEDGPVF